MKKIILIILCFCFLFSFAACQGKVDEPDISPDYSDAIPEDGKNDNDDVEDKGEGNDNEGSGGVWTPPAKFD